MKNLQVQSTFLLANPETIRHAGAGAGAASAKTDIAIELRT